MNARVLLVAPSPRHLRAGAVWVTISNWAEALEHRWGEAPILTSDGLLDHEEARRQAFGGASSIGTGTTRPRSKARINAEVLAKDLRAFAIASTFAARARRLAPSSRPAFVWQHHDLFQSAGFRLARAYECPVVLFVDAPVVWEARLWGVQRPGWGHAIELVGERRQFRNADVVACVSDEVAEEVVRQGADPSSLLLTPCTADTERFRKPNRDARAALGLEDLVVVGWAGSFRRFHHADLLVQAAALAQATVPDLALLLVGDGPERRRSAELAGEASLRHVVFTGSVSQADVPDYLHAMDIAVIPSGHESFHYSPLKLKEYLAAGRAVVAPRIGEMARILHHGEDALLYPPGDTEGMAAMIVELATNPTLRRAVGAAGRALFEREFEITRQVRDIEDKLGVRPESS